ncbi:MAG: hypothetical protein ACD_9C00291G0005 [uncultured bacterium]|nr:MAG: hypothetical protein ACD_9C00291G0005 [uncultured bacterium]
MAGGRQITMEIFKSKFKALGTDVEIQLVVSLEKDAEKAKNDLELSKQQYLKFEKIFSRFDEESELSKLNNNLNDFSTSSVEMTEIIKSSIFYYHQCEKLFDPRVIDFLNNIGYYESFHSKNFFKGKKFIENKPNEVDLEQDLKIENEKILFFRKMDFSGIAKGYITDKIAKFLIDCGWKNFLIDSGGDMYAKGVDEEDQPWRIGVEGISEEKILFSLTNKAVATSGISRRKWEVENKKVHHIINPQSPNNFNFDLKSVSVIAQNTQEADVWAKTLFLMGKEKGIEYSRNHDIPALFLHYNGNVSISAKAKEFLI